ncbi:MAG: SDR family oxidoreductase [Solirubrobacterales bacterium]
MRIAVTAATGQLGSAIVRAVAAQSGSENVVALARNPANAKDLGVEVRPGDYDSRDQLEAALGDVDHLLLVSGMAAPDERVVQHRRVIDAARKCGVRKIVYTSVQGPETDTAFSPIVQSNRQTEEDLKASGLAWSIGRNGIYIEPDVEYAANYVAQGEISNCAGEGRCGYTTRPELAYAYARMLTEPNLDGKTLELSGQPITQAELAGFLSSAFDARIVYRSMGESEYQKDRVSELGEFIGTVVAGIYQGIRRGAYDTAGDFEVAFGRPHQTWQDYFSQIKVARQQGR